MAAVAYAPGQIYAQPARAALLQPQGSERYVIVHWIFQQRFHARPGQPCLPALPLTRMARHCIVHSRTAQAWVRDHAGRHHVCDGPPVSVVRESVFDLPLCPVSRTGRWWRWGRGLHLQADAPPDDARTVQRPVAGGVEIGGAACLVRWTADVLNTPVACAVRVRRCRVVLQPQVGLTPAAHRRCRVVKALRHMRGEGFHRITRHVSDAHHGLGRIPTVPTVGRAISRFTDWADTFHGAMLCQF
jgi:hypothetical protein